MGAVKGALSNIAVFPLNIGIFHCLALSIFSFPWYDAGIWNPDNKALRQLADRVVTGQAPN